MGTPDPGRHEGRVAIVTGASRGIGRAVARRLAAEGAAVVVAAKSVEPHRTLPGTIVDCVEAIRGDGGTAIWHGLDVRDTDAVAAMVDRTIDEFGRVDHLVNNAGAIVLGDVASVTPKQFDLMFDVNVRASYAAAHLVLPHMVRQGYGHIVMCSPPLHVDPSPGMAAYMVTKLGMTRVATSIAAEHQDDGVAANAIWPVTMIDTAAVRINELGTPEQWRTPEIMADAMSALLGRAPATCTGRALTDEEILREEGIVDLDRYWVLGAPPAHQITIVGNESPLR